MHREIDFEHEIEQALIASGGYQHGDPHGYDHEIALFPAEVVAFVQRTQPKIWDRLLQLDADKAATMLVDSLAKELAAKGSLAVLRSGFKCVGKTVRLAYFLPNTGLDPEASDRFQDNCLTIIRQVKTKSGAIPDIVLAVNGLPVATLELKNPMSATRWNVENAKYQYRFERDPKELLFAFKKRYLVHFALDSELVFMTTKLEGKDTLFLPFNLGHNCGAGNPPAEGDVRTTYLWHKVLSRYSLMDILARFNIAIATTGKSFAVIVDEAHSSQSGETAMELRKILNKDGIESAIAAQLLDMEDEALSEEAKKALLREQLKRAKHLSITTACGRPLRKGSSTMSWPTTPVISATTN